MKFESNINGVIEETAGCGNVDSVAVQEVLEEPEELCADELFDKQGKWQQPKGQRSLKGNDIDKTSH